MFDDGRVMDLNIVGTAGIRGLKNIWGRRIGFVACRFHIYVWQIRTTWPKTVPKYSAAAGGRLALRVNILSEKGNGDAPNGNVFPTQMGYQQLKYSLPKRGKNSIRDIPDVELSGRAAFYDIDGLHSSAFPIE